MCCGIKAQTFSGWLTCNISWPKSKLQNIDSGPKPLSISVDGNTVESVDSFVYLQVIINHIGWSMSSRPNGVYRPCLCIPLCSHMASLKSKADIERQAPDTQHQHSRPLGLCGGANLVVHGTSGSTSYETIPPVWIGRAVDR